MARLFDFLILMFIFVMVIIGTITTITAVRIYFDDCADLKINNTAVKTPKMECSNVQGLAA